MMPDGWMSTEEFRRVLADALAARLEYWKAVRFPREEPPMRVCVICRFETEQDDCVVSSANTDRTVCLRCFTREIADTRLLSKGLRREVTLAMGE